jgi:hypothetical protein
MPSDAKRRRRKGPAVCNPLSSITINLGNVPCSIALSFFFFCFTEMIPPPLGKARLDLLARDRREMSDLDVTEKHVTTNHMAGK